MKVRELKKLLADVDDDIEIVVSAPDHEYREASASIEGSLYDGSVYTEWNYGEPGQEEINLYGQLTQVVVVN